MSAALPQQPQKQPPSPEIDLNSIEDAIATSCQQILCEKLGRKLEVIPGLPQIVTPEIYRSGEEVASSFAFGQIVPLSPLHIIGINAKLLREIGMDISWFIAGVEKIWREYFPTVSCRLGGWNSDPATFLRLPADLNLRFLRHAVFLYQETKPESCGFFDTLSIYP